MLLLDSRVREINGISVFPDHADPEQWYYMPTSPHLTTVQDAALGVEVPQFLLIGFRGDAGTGGFLSFDCNVGASPAQVEDVARAIANSENLRNMPRVGPVPLVDGTVRLLMLGRQTGDAPPAVGAAGPQFVLKIDQAAKPALYGTNQAAFSVRLDQDGFTVMQQCLGGEILPVAVVYSLEFLGLRPAYAIKLSIDWDRVQKHMDERFSASAMFFSTDIAKAVDELVEKRAIVLEADTFVPEGADTQGIIDRRDAALAQVRNMITDAFFTVSLPPWTPEKKSDWEKGLEAVGKLAVTTSALAAGGPAASSTNASFGYSRMDYTRVDKKILNVNFSERVTIKRSINPQGHLAALFKLLRDTSLPQDRFVRHVSLDNDFFKKRRLKVTTRADFAADDIASINVRARYGQQPKNALLTSTQATAEFEWLSEIRNGAMTRDVEVAYEVGFKNVDGAERPLKVNSKPKTVEVENEELVPRELYAMVPVPVVAENFPWERYTSVEIHLRYTDAENGIAQKDMVRLTKSKADAVWKMFVLDPRNTSFEHQIIFRALDNRDTIRPVTRSDETQITIRNPYPTRRVVQVVPAVNWAEVSEVFVDLRYEGGGNDALVEDSLSFKEGSAAQSFSADLRNPERKAVFYKVGISFKDGRFVEMPESMTNERRVVVRPDMKGRRIVEVRPPAAFGPRRMRRATVALRFEDFAAGLNFADTFQFESADAKGEFEYDYVDELRKKFEYRADFVFENGLTQSTDWTASDATEIAPALP
jgi:hypothetical protein